MKKSVAYQAQLESEGRLCPPLSFPPTFLLRAKRYYFSLCHSDRTSGLVNNAKLKATTPERLTVATCIEDEGKQPRRGKSCTTTQQIDKTLSVR